LIVHGRATRHPRDGAVEVAVVVPLDEIDSTFTHGSVNPFEEVGPHLLAGEIEHQLVPPFGCVFPDTKDPVGVTSRQVGIPVDHLGLEPQAKLHAELMHKGRQFLHAMRPLLDVHHPVSKARSVVGSSREPSVVEHEAFDSHAVR
jgi:hypothetical protein